MRPTCSTVRMVRRARTVNPASCRDWSLDPMNLAYRGALGDPGVMRDQIRVGTDVETDARRPTRHRIQAGVGDRVVLAQQIRVRGEVLVDKGEARSQPFA